MNILVAGDIILANPWSSREEPGFRRIVELIRSADVSVANLEVVLSDGTGHPQVDSGGMHLTTSGRIAEEIQWAGFDMVGHANNHSFDWGAPGLIRSIENLDRAGLPHAGVGEDLQSARAPVFLDVNGKVVALVSMTTTLERYARAERSRHDVPGRPGVNPLEIKSSDFTERVESALCKGVDALGTIGIRWPGIPVLKPNPDDVRANLSVIAEAKKQADFVLVSLHSHHRGAWRQQFTRQMVDVGADVVFMQGRHYVQGVEVYRGKPILYGLGSIAMELQKFTIFPDPMYRHYDLGDDASIEDLTRLRQARWTGPYYTRPGLWEGVVGSIAFGDGKLRELSLVPIELGCRRPFEERGLPLWPEDEVGREIIDQVKQKSRRFGTRIDYDPGKVMGTVVL